MKFPFGRSIEFDNGGFWWYVTKDEKEDGWSQTGWWYSWFSLGLTAVFAIVLFTTLHWVFS